MPRRCLQLWIALLCLVLPAATRAAPPPVGATLHVDLGPRPSLRARSVRTALVQALRAERALVYRPLAALLEPDLVAAGTGADGAAPGAGSDARIEVTPAGAEVQIDGTFVGFAPLTARGLAPGRHQVRISRIGFHTRTIVVELGPGANPGAAPTPVTTRLEPLAGRPADLLARALEEAAAATRGRDHPHQRAAARRLGQRVLLLARLSLRGGLVTVKLFAYDARSGRSVSRATVSVTAEDPERGCRRLVASVVPFLRAPPPRRSAAEGSWLARARRETYFWPAVGAGVAIIGAAVGLGVYYGTRGDGPGQGRRLLALPAVSRW